MAEPAEIPQLRLVTVAYHSSRQIKSLLESLQTATRHRVQAVVVDNSEEADADLPQICAEYGAAYFPRPDNPGFGAASNYGAGVPIAGQAAEPWVVFANPDLRFLSGSLDSLLAEAQAHPEAAVIGPALVDETGKRYPTGRSFPYFSVGIGHAVLGRVWPGNPWTQAYWGTAWRGHETCQVDWVSGACQMLRRTDWQILCGYDRHFFMYFEDTDLCLKAARKLGKTTLLAAGVEAVHTQGASTGNVTVGAGASCARHNPNDPQTPPGSPDQQARNKPNLRALRAHHESALIFLRHLYPQAYWRPLLALIGWGLRLRLAILLRRR